MMSAGHGTKADPDAHGRKADIMDIATLAQNVTALHRCAEQCDAADARVAELTGDGAAEYLIDRAEADQTDLRDLHAKHFETVRTGLIETFPWITGVHDDFASDVLTINGTPAPADADALSLLDALAEAFDPEDAARHTLYFEDAPDTQHLAFLS